MITREEARRLLNTEQYQKELNEQLRNQERRIREASASGSNRVCFSANKHESDVKRILIENGFRFEPTGYSGGVWQLTEDIVW